MAMTLGAFTVPTTIENHGAGYKFNPPESLHDNGLGEPVDAPYASLTWTFDIMEPEDYDWITDTLLGGASGVKFFSAFLYDNNRTLRAFSGVTARRPTTDGISNGWYRNVVWQMDYILS